MPEHGHGHGGNMTPEQQKAMIEQEMRLYEQMGKVKAEKAELENQLLLQTLQRLSKRREWLPESWMLIFMAQTYLSYSAWKARK